MLAELYRLRHAIFGEGKVLGSKSLNGLPILIPHRDRFDYKLHLHGQGKIISSAGRLVLPNLLRACKSAGCGDNYQKS
jgi:hypothetical protein